MTKTISKNLQEVIDLYTKSWRLNQEIEEFKSSTKPEDMDDKFWKRIETQTSELEELTRQYYIARNNL